MGKVRGSIPAPPRFSLEFLPMIRLPSGNFLEDDDAWSKRRWSAPPAVPPAVAPAEPLAEPAAPEEGPKKKRGRKRIERIEGVELTPAEHHIVQGIMQILRHQGAHVRAAVAKALEEQ